MYESLLVRKHLEKPTPSIPEAFLALIRELNALGLDFSLRKFENGFYSTTNVKDLEKEIFQELETRLKLRALLSRKKVEQFAKPLQVDQSEIMIQQKVKEKRKILEKFRSL
jgi:hypothetical protein